MIRILLSLILVTISLTGCKTSFFVKSFDYLKLSNSSDQVIEDVKIALVLSGGGARAIAQIGVLEVFEENDIPIDLIVGTSGGSIIGALYADNPDSKALKEIGLEFKASDVGEISFEDAFEGTRSLRGGLDSSSGEKFLMNKIHSKYFHELKIPFIAVATNLKDGQTVSLKKGDIIPAIKASCAMPGLFSPVELYGMILVDGGVSAPIAVDVAKEYDAKLIVAVDVSSTLDDDEIKNMFDVVARSADIVHDSLIKLQGQKADILIKPDMKGKWIFDDEKNQELYELGRKAAEAKIPEIKAFLKEKFIEKSK